MKLRQRRWIIWSRPVHGDSPDGGKVMFTGEPYAPALRTGQPVRTTNTKGMEKNSNVPINKGKKSSTALKKIGNFALKAPGAILRFAYDMVGEIIECGKVIYGKVK